MVNLPAISLYAAFGSKEQLDEKVIEHHQAGEGKTVAKEKAQLGAGPFSTRGINV